MVTVLQLDTQFPRVPGDVASADTYLCDIEIIRIPRATVGEVVSNKPELIDIAPFENAVTKARGSIIVTSCGFLSYWQNHLAALTDKTFISSSLTEISHLSQRYTPEEILTVTFDKNSLTEKHFGDYPAYANEIAGLPNEMHLRQVISNNLKEIDANRVAQELRLFITQEQQPQHRHLLLECTNLPPYKATLQQQTGLEVSDILTCIESRLPGTIREQFLNQDL